MEMNGLHDDALLEKLNEGKVVQLAPVGISMTPFIRGGQDRVLVKKAEEIAVGDIVLVTYCGKLLLHRVYAIHEPHIVLMGDGLLKGNEVVTRSEVWGKVIQILKPNGKCIQPGKAWLWRHTIGIRRYLLKVDRKWNQWFRKQQ